jgi:hypothetical protein
MIKKAVPALESMKSQGLQAVRNKLEYWQRPARQDHACDSNGALAQRCEERAYAPMEAGVTARSLTNPELRLLAAVLRFVP